MLWRALFAFLALPGMVAFVIPWLMRPRGVVVNPWGYLPLSLGIVVLLWCVRDFYVAGKGTLAPWSPPKNLVTVGLYRWSRNPMYVGVLTILVGWAMLFGSRNLWIYVAFMAIVFHLRVMLYEEPWLSRTHGNAWTAYKASTSRWF
jgi:protein-S-isoprenylcysteine O-methyltransferase Ste14